MLKFCTKIFQSLILIFFINNSFAASGNCVNLTKINKNFFNESMGMIWHTDKKSWLVWEKEGKIFLLSPKTGFSSEIANLNSNLDIRGDGGLLGMAFHPKFPFVPYLYVTRTILSEGSRNLVLEKYNISGYDIDLDSKQELLRIVVPGIKGTGGFMMFDSSGSLYVAIGDGSDDGKDAAKNSINPQTLLGSVLRLDVTTDDNKALPAQGNPFMDLLDGAREVYAYGFRNPFRFSIDNPTGDIWLGDSGLNVAGEVNFIIPSYFYGWSCLEGSRKISREAVCNTFPLSSQQTPVFQYSKSFGQQIIGGYIYRGKKHSDWYGHYFFADYGNGKIWNTLPLQGQNFSKKTLITAYEGPIIPVSFATDIDNELYLVDYQGKIMKMEARQCSEPQKTL